MKYNKSNPKTQEHLSRLLHWLVLDVLSAGGDGDAIWYSKWHSVYDILPLVEELNKHSFGTNGVPLGWTIDFDEEFETIIWANNQEGMVITNSKAAWDRRPDWQHCAIQPDLYNFYTSLAK